MIYWRIVVRLLNPMMTIPLHYLDCLVLSCVIDHNSPSLRSARKAIDVSIGHHDSCVSFSCPMHKLADSRWIAYRRA